MKRPALAWAHHTSPTQGAETPNQGHAQKLACTSTISSYLFLVERNLKLKDSSTTILDIASSDKVPSVDGAVAAVSSLPPSSVPCVTVTQREEHWHRRKQLLGGTRGGMSLRSNQELQAKDNIFPLTYSMLSVAQQQQPGKMNKRSAVSLDEKQLATENKRRRLVKAAVKPEEEFGVKKEEEIEGGSQKDKDEPEDSMKPPVVVKKEEEDVTREKEDDDDNVQREKDEPEDSKKPPVAVKEEEKDETEVKVDGEGDYQRDKDEPEDSKQLPAAIKEEEEEETKVKADLEEMIESVVDEARNVIEEMEVNMQYDTTRLLESSGVVSTTQMLETLQEQVDKCEAKIKRMQEDHEEALVREKERGDRLENQLQRLKQLYPEIEENDPTDCDEESFEERGVEEHPEQESHEMDAEDYAESTKANAEGCAKKENTEVCSHTVAEENAEEYTGRSLDETRDTSKSDDDDDNDDDSDYVTVDQNEELSNCSTVTAAKLHVVGKSPVPLVSSDSSPGGVGIRRVGSLVASCGKSARGKNARGQDAERKWNVQFEKLGEFKEKHGRCEFFCAVARFPSS
jgi:hypothetical protein